MEHIHPQFYELARKEIGALILSDEHPNIVRCFAMEEDNEFVYLALERCRQSLNDLVNSEGGANSLVDEARMPRPYCMQAKPLTPLPLSLFHEPNIHRGATMSFCCMRVVVFPRVDPGHCNLIGLYMPVSV